jgi:hypothetical protein
MLRKKSFQLTHEARSGPGIAVNHLSHIRPEKAILSFKALLIGLLKSLNIYPVKCRFAALLWRI